MQTSVAVTALMMGIVGGPHCVAMCGAACAGISRAAAARSTQALWVFQLSRMLGYALLGRGFAYVGVAPLYVGELTLLLCLGAALLATRPQGQQQPAQCQE